MDASQYKDYVLVLLFIKYVSDKYAGQPFAPITIPAGASFKDMVALKGKPDIGDQINKKIIAPLANANKLSDFPDFNDAAKLGTGKEMVDRLTNLVAIFENPALDFSKNRAEGDDILGDAYEYLMRHFATESGKSKGQFYTPAEVRPLLPGWRWRHFRSRRKSSYRPFAPWPARPRHDEAVRLQAIVQPDVRECRAARRDGGSRPITSG